MSDKKDNIIPFPNLNSPKTTEDVSANIDPRSEEEKYQDDLDTLKALQPYLNKSSQLMVAQNVANNANKTTEEVKKDLEKPSVDPKD